MSGHVLALQDLRISRPDDGAVLVAGTTLAVDLGETVGIVGESGSGKSLTLRAVTGILPSSLAVEGDVACDPRTAMIFQEPATALNPTRRVGDLVALVWRRHHPGASRRDARDAAVDLLDRVGIPALRARASAWPHELSGGMRQRVMIAAALATDPRLLLCDEPTTALDVRVQAQILDLLASLVDSSDLALLFVSHDLAVVAQVCRRLVVMRDGQVVETGSTEALVSDPQHPYTAELLAANLARRMTQGADA